MSVEKGWGLISGLKIEDEEVEALMDLTGEDPDWGGPVTDRFLLNAIQEEGHIVVGDTEWFLGTVVTWRWANDYEDGEDITDRLRPPVEMRESWREEMLATAREMRDEGIDVPQALVDRLNRIADSAPWRWYAVQEIG